MILAMSQTKALRRRAIVALLDSASIGTQDDLQRELRRRGIRVTQATLSRDLTELGVARTHTADGLRYAAPEANTRALGVDVVESEVVSITGNESLIVIRTLVGCAHSVAVYIDAIKSPDILGTIAGDDTILIVPRSAKALRPLLRTLHERLG
jgi:transcriptional regulator of arginine metabolism